MTLEFTNKQFRRLLDLVYIGNWILNSTRGDQRFADYDEVESLVFGKALVSGMPALAEVYEGEIVPSRAFAEGGIHEAIMEYENNVFFDILAEDLARRDMDDVPIDESMALTTSWWMPRGCDPGRSQNAARPKGRAAFLCLLLPSLRPETRAGRRTCIQVRRPAFCLRLRPSGPCPLFWPPPPPLAEAWAQGRPSPPGCPGGPAPGRPPRR